MTMKRKNIVLAVCLLLAAGLCAQTAEEVVDGLEYGLSFYQAEGETIHIVYGETMEGLVAQLPSVWAGHRLVFTPREGARKLCRRGIGEPYCLNVRQRGGDTVEVAVGQWYLHLKGRKLAIEADAEWPFVWYYTDGAGCRVRKTNSEWYGEQVRKFEQQTRKGFLTGFYKKYLAYSCGSETWDYDAANALQKKCYSDSLMAAYLRSGEPETDRFVDYDMLIQGQDCWPTICVESVEPVGETYWMRVTLLVPASSDNGMEEDWRRCVYCYIDQIQGMYRIACIRDQYNQLGEAAEALVIEN